MPQGGQIIGQGNAPYVLVNANDAADLINKISQYLFKNPIFVPAGNYNIGSNIIQLDFPATFGEGIIIAAGMQSTVITATGTNVLNARTTDTSGPQLLRLEGMRINHYCSNATDITLNLDPVLTQIRDVYCDQRNATLQGTGFLCGRQGMYGYGSTWDTLLARHYGTGFNIGIDHFQGNNLNASDCSGIGFRIGHAPSGGDGPYFVTLVNPTYYSSIDGSRTSVYPYRFDDCRSSVCLVNPSIENIQAGAMTNPIFTTDVFNNKVIIQTPTGSSAATTSTLYDTRDLYKWQGSGGNEYKTQNQGNSTGTGAQQTIAHGINGIPSQVLLSEYTTGGALAIQSAAADATNIYITATLNKTYLWNAFL